MGPEILYVNIKGNTYGNEKHTVDSRKKKRKDTSSLRSARNLWFWLTGWLGLHVRHSIRKTNLYFQNIPQNSEVYRPNTKFLDSCSPPARW